MYFFHMVAYSYLDHHWTGLCKASRDASTPQAAYMRSVAKVHNLTTKTKRHVLVSALMVWTLHGYTPVDKKKFKECQSAVTYHRGIGGYVYHIGRVWGREVLLLRPSVCRHNRNDLLLLLQMLKGTPLVIRANACLGARKFNAARHK